MELTEKQVYARWTHTNETAWRLDVDEVKSARKLLDSVEGVDIEHVPLTEEPGRLSFACVFKKAVEAWAEKTEELALDSTCSSFISRIQNDTS